MEIVNIHLLERLTKHNKYIIEKIFKVKLVGLHMYFTYENTKSRSIVGKRSRYKSI